MECLVITAFCGVVVIDFKIYQIVTHHRRVKQAIFINNWIISTLLEHESDRPGHFFVLWSDIAICS